MKTVKELIRSLHIKNIIGNAEVLITGICFDSRSVQTDNMFIAVRGTNVDGHDYIEKAIPNPSSVYDVVGMGLKDALYLLESQGLSGIVS